MKSKIILFGILLSMISISSYAAPWYTINLHWSDGHRGCDGHGICNVRGNFLWWQIGDEDIITTTGDGESTGDVEIDGHNLIIHYNVEKPSADNNFTVDDPITLPSDMATFMGYKTVILTPGVYPIVADPDGKHAGMVAVAFTAY